MNAFDACEAAYNRGFEDGRKSAERTGRWSEKYDPYEDPLFRRTFVCDACGDYNTYGTPKYCPECGARMLNDLVWTPDGNIWKERENK